jgi:heme-degrading monooxygenase HmoA
LPADASERRPRAEGAGRLQARIAAAQNGRSAIMISRQWRGLARAARAHDYITHLKSETFPKLVRIPGFISASILRRDLPAGVEFLIVTQWESLEAIKRFAGDDPEVAVVPAQVQAIMVEYDHTVRHFEVVE